MRPEASPRLRAAALPLYVRLIDPALAEEIARSEMKGPPAARAAGAAVWGTVAISRPEVATAPLKSFLYDPSPEVRIEAARSFAYLKRDGIALAGKAIADPNAEVERAAIESALALAPVSPYQVADMLGHAVKTVRPAVRRALIEALGRMGETRPAAVLPPLARTLKDPDPGARAAAAAAFCGISKKNAAAASPYLRIAARDDHHEVRAAAASCLGNLGEGDPKGAAKIAVELAGRRRGDRSHRRRRIVGAARRQRARDRAAGADEAGGRSRSRRPHRRRAGVHRRGRQRRRRARRDGRVRRIAARRRSRARAQRRAHAGRRRRAAGDRRGRGRNRPGAGAAAGDRRR